MDDLTPPLLSAIREVKWHLLSGRSVKDSAAEFVRVGRGEFALKLRELLVLREQGTLGDKATAFENPYQRAFWDLLERGLSGHPILEPLVALEDEADRVALNDLDAHVASLPFKALLPLLFFQFPAFVMLLVWPLLRELSL